IKQHIVNDKNEMEDKQASLRIDLEKVSELSAGNYTSLSNQLHTIDGQMKEIALKHGATIDELEKYFDHRLNEMHTSIEDKQASLQTDIKKLSEVSDENHKSLNDQLHTIDGQMKETELKHEAIIDELEKSFDHRLNDMHISMEKEIVQFQAQINEQQEEMGVLSRSLKMTKIISYISVAILFILIILMISEVFG